MKFKFLKNEDNTAQSIDLSRALKPPARIIPLAVPMPRSGNDRAVSRREIVCACSLYAESKMIRDAVIVDISQSGARVQFEIKGLLPRYLRVEAINLKLNRRVRVVWQDTQSAGLQFILPTRDELNTEEDDQA
ncbi:MAG: hypothetical protein Hens3KO_15050 [Henriciella sp.]